MIKNRIILLTIISLVFLYSSCNKNNIKIPEKTNSLEIKVNKPSADSVLSIFKNFWPNLDSIENELINNLSVKIITSSYEGEPDETCSYFLDTINYTLRSEYYSGGVSISELRILFTDNAIIVISSSFNGTNSFTNQKDFEIYNYNFNKNSFSIDTFNRNLFKIQLKDFFKDNTPDSIISEFEGHSSYFFQIIYTESGIAETQLIDESFEKNINDNKWLKGNKITYYYKDNKFIKTEPFFSNE